MATYFGFSTINAGQVRPTQIASGWDESSGGFVKPQVYGKKFTGLDEQIVIQDFINSLNIPQGSKPGNPKYGTTIWNYIFEPNDVATQTAVENEIRRVASLDPRIAVNSVLLYPNALGILVEIEFAVVPFNDVKILQVLFDQAASKAYSQ